MSAHVSRASDPVRKFWDKYLNVLRKSGIQAPFAAWHVKRAEAFIKASSKRLAEHCPADVEAYLREAGRDRRLKAWQFRQIVDAIRTLFEVVGVPWLEQVDWAQWRASATTLETTHPTVARCFDVLPETGARAQEARTDKGALAETRRRIRIW